MKFEKVKEFANITEEENKDIERGKKLLRQNPSGKMGIQASLSELSEVTDALADIILGLKYQKIFLVDELEVLFLGYSTGKMGMFKEKELDFRFRNETSKEAERYKVLRIKKELLTIFSERVEKMTWDIKEKKADLKVAHSTDY